MKVTVCTYHVMDIQLAVREDSMKAVSQLPSQGVPAFRVSYSLRWFADIPE